MTIAVRRFLPLVGMTLDAVKRKKEKVKAGFACLYLLLLPNQYKADCHSERSEESPYKVEYTEARNLLMLSSASVTEASPNHFK
jgi:hypothetical protein